MSRRTIIALEKDAAREPRLDTAIKLAAALGADDPRVLFPELLDLPGADG